MIIVKDDEIGNTPEWVRAEVPADDLFLDEAAFSQKPCLLITSDKTLFQILSGHGEIEARLLDELAVEVLMRGL